MPNRRITVTQNIQYCIDALQRAVKGLPEGDLKTEAKKAVKYLKDTAGGKPQSYRGEHCNWADVKPSNLLPKTHKFYKP